MRLLLLGMIMCFGAMSELCARGWQRDSFANVSDLHRRAKESNTRYFNQLNDHLTKEITSYNKNSYLSEDQAGELKKLLDKIGEDIAKGLSLNVDTHNIEDAEKFDEEIKSKSKDIENSFLQIQKISESAKASVEYWKSVIKQDPEQIRKLEKAKAATLAENAKSGYEADIDNLNKSIDLAKTKLKAVEKAYQDRIAAQHTDDPVGSKLFFAITAVGNILNNKSTEDIESQKLKSLLSKGKRLIGIFNGLLNQKKALEDKNKSMEVEIKNIETQVDQFLTEVESATGVEVPKTTIATTPIATVAAISPSGAEAVAKAQTAVAVTEAVSAVAVDTTPAAEAAPAAATPAADAPAAADTGSTTPAPDAPAAQDAPAATPAAS